MTPDEAVKEFHEAHERGEATSELALAVVRAYVEAEVQLPDGLVYGLSMTLSGEDAEDFQEGCEELLADVDLPESDHC